MFFYANLMLNELAKIYMNLESFNHNYVFNTEIIEFCTSPKSRIACKNFGAKVQQSHRCHQFYVTTQRQIVAGIVVDWSSGTER